jgi:hypothetical protein
VETPEYLSAADEAGLTEAERLRIVSYIAECPRSGDLIEGTGGARKVRFAGRGKGKSGGYRVITYFGGDDVPVFLLDVYSKGEKVTLSGAQRKELKSTLRLIAGAYRESVRRKVKPIGRRVR